MQGRSGESVPDGRRVTTLTNVTPIHAEDGTVASLVVTMQDLAPFEELEWMRAESRVYE